ncbi:hypothetical protein [Paenibacillus kribbensis]|uniref:hypothetical protein n=1 Tax=Paenibacillus kribbensis TaxID=172713 RepID=UPI00114CBBA5|nr:hypothetical protein [Paenibacillus kribbensis]
MQKLWQKGKSLSLPIMSGKGTQTEQVSQMDGTIRSNEIQVGTFQSNRLQNGYQVVHAVADRRVLSPLHIKTSNYNHSYHFPPCILKNSYKRLIFA